MPRRRALIDAPRTHLRLAVDAHARIGADTPASDESATAGEPSGGDSPRRRQAQRQRRNRGGKFA